MSPIFERLFDTSPPIGFYNVDVDVVSDISQAAGVRAISISSRQIRTVALKRIEADRDHRITAQAPSQK
jgi:hypothetical protein